MRPLNAHAPTFQPEAPAHSSSPTASSSTGPSASVVTSFPIRSKTRRPQRTPATPGFTDLTRPRHDDANSTYAVGSYPACTHPRCVTCRSSCHGHPGCTYFKDGTPRCSGIGSSPWSHALPPVSGSPAADTKLLRRPERRGNLPGLGGAF